MIPHLEQTDLQGDDLELVRRTARGDGTAFHQIVDRYADYLYRLAMSICGNRADAEDICQETLVAALQAAKNFDGRASVKTWLARILVRRAAKIYRKAKFMRQTLRIDGAHDEPDRSASGQKSAATVQVDHRIDVLAVLQTLGGDHREVLVLREMQGLSYDEIAATLGVPRGTVESRLHRAREQMRQKLKGYQP